MHIGVLVATPRRITLRLHVRGQRLEFLLEIAGQFVWLGAQIWKHPSERTRVRKC